MVSLREEIQAKMTSGPCWNIRIHIKIFIILVYNYILAISTFLQRQALRRSRISRWLNFLFFRAVLLIHICVLQSVFAVRIGTSTPRWENGRWVWERFATATSPRLPSWIPGVQEKIPIPWPEPNKPQLPERQCVPSDVVPIAHTNFAFLSN